MKWSNKTPVEDGFYWVKEKNEKARIVSIYDRADGLKEYAAMVAYSGNDMCHSLCNIAKGKPSWYGPLKIPK